MIWILAAFFLFLLLLMLPILLAGYRYFRSRNSCDSILPISQHRTRDPRYFSGSFKKLFLEAFQKSDGKTVLLHKGPETFLSADEIAAQDFPVVCSDLIAAEKKNFCPPAGVCFRKEIFAFHSALIGAGSTVRAIHAEKDLDLASDTVVVRWADGDGTVTVDSDCDLGISTTSGKKICIGRNCRFRRLYAPVIEIGQPPEDLPSVDMDLQDPAAESLRSHRVGADQADEHGIVRKSVISNGRLWVEEGLTISGSLRAHSGIKVGRNTVICGNIFSDSQIYLQKGCRVLGNIFSQGNIFCESGVEVGIPGEIRSVIARRHITLEQGCRIYGFLSSEKSGICAPRSRSRRKQPIHVSPRPVHRPLSPGFTGITAFLISAFSILAVTLSAVFLSSRLNSGSQPDYPISDEIFYENQGLDQGASLSSMPLAITDRQVDFPDRVLLRPDFSDGQAEALCQSLNDFMETIAANRPSIKLYSMVVPLRIGFEGSFSENAEFLEAVREDRSKFIALENKISSEITPLCNFLPLTEPLSAHQEEYIFYRGAPTWTARGAYYGSQVFLSAAGLDPFPIGSFYETARTKSYGILPKTDGQTVSDRRYVYLYRDYNPMVENLTSHEKAPMYSSVRNSYSAFMGGSYGLGVLDGLARNGRVLLLVGYKNAQVLAPWTVTRFEKILYLNLDIFNVESEPFWELFDQYGITDCLAVQDADTLSLAYLTDKYSLISRLR